MNGPPDRDAFDAAVSFATAQPGWTARVGARHTPRPDGSCAGCGSYRLVRWPCVLVHIARRAEQTRAPRDVV